MNKIPKATRDAQLKALQMASRAIMLLQPSWQLPDWFLCGVSLRSEQLSHNQWNVEFYLYPPRKLEKGEYWVIENEYKYIRSTDQVTGKNLVHIMGDSNLDNYQILFKVEVDINSGNILIRKQTDLSVLSRDDFDIRLLELPQAIRLVWENILSSMPDSHTN